MLQLYLDTLSYQRVEITYLAGQQLNIANNMGLSWDQDGAKISLSWDK